LIILSVLAIVVGVSYALHCAVRFGYSQAMIHVLEDMRAELDSVKGEEGFALVIRIVQRIEARKVGWTARSR